MIAHDMQHIGSSPRVRVRLEPELEMMTVTYSSEQCRALARLYYRWAKQLYVKASILAPEPGAVRRGHAAKRLRQFLVAHR
ncbi:MAG TPA: hypothetical protein VEH27_06065 [Methylomirabilota bacterium]|nr:hypothetical protein [Methylomirabilota bacterium]